MKVIFRIYHRRKQWGCGGYGSNRILKDKILSIQIENPLIVIEKAAFEVKAIHEEKARLEPAKNALNKEEMKEIYSKSILMSG